jgi:3-hydroxyisobutyrate dehydrogenase-like beta-hydroxyacid dehydrogenase
MRVGWIGLGQIGLPMALRVLANGHQVIAHSRRPTDHQHVVVGGGVLSSSLEPIVTGCDVLCINVFSEQQLRDILLGADKVIETIPSETIVVIHSTVSPSIMHEVAAAKPRLNILDAAFSGTAADAENGDIVLMVGGDASLLDRVDPVLRSYAKSIDRVGDLGTGMFIKLTNNLLFAAQIQMSFAALRIASQAGINSQVAASIIGKGSGGSYAMKTLGAYENPQQAEQVLHHYLNKDVAVAREALGSSELGPLGSMTQCYG